MLIYKHTSARFDPRWRTVSPRQETTLTINTTYIYLMLILPCTSNTCLLWITREIFDLVTLEHEGPISAYVTLGLKRGPGKKKGKK